MFPDRQPRILWRVQGCPFAPKRRKAIPDLFQYSAPPPPPPDGADSTSLPGVGAPPAPQNASCRRASALPSMRYWCWYWNLLIPVNVELFLVRQSIQSARGAIGDPNFTSGPLEHVKSTADRKLFDLDRRLPINPVKCLPCARTSPGTFPGQPPGKLGPMSGYCPVRP